MDTFKHRIITGLIYATLVFGTTYVSIYSFFAFFLLINILGISEMYQLAKLNFHTNPIKILGIILAITLFTASFVYELTNSPILYFLLYIEIILCFILEIYRNKPNAINNVSHTFFPIIFFTLPLSFLNLMIENDGEYNTNNVLFILLLIWTYDSSAYIIGKIYGKHKLFKRISPNKSWEGLVGGSIISLIVGFFIAHFFDSFILQNSIIITFLIIIFGTFSDLYASLIKRTVAIKDFGKILPGHGGIVDRVDSMLLSVPAIFIYMQITKLS